MTAIMAIITNTFLWAGEKRGIAVNGSKTVLPGSGQTEGIGDRAHRPNENGVWLSAVKDAKAIASGEYMVSIVISDEKYDHQRPAQCAGC